MIFASPIFLFVFLPLTLLAYFALPVRFGTVILLVASLAFYIWGEGFYASIVLFSIGFNFCIGRALGRATDGASRHRWLAAGVGANLLLLAVFKYSNFAVENINLVLGAMGAATLAVATIPLPLGISFFTFHSISYLVDIQRQSATAQQRISRFALYILLFPQLIAGPIIRYKDIAAQLGSRPKRIDDFAQGARRVLIGLAKKVLIANTLGQAADRVFAIAPGEINTPIAWLGVICYTLQLYFDFSGYSDMAIGLMRIFGFRVMENFNYPYISQSVGEFWRRWHISLSTWFRDYVYIPLGGNRRGKRRAYLNLVIVFMLCGLWHGANWTFVAWGAWHGVFLVLERTAWGTLLGRLPRWLRHGYALLAVIGGWVLFRSGSLAQAGHLFAALAGFGANTHAQYPVRMIADDLVIVTLVIASVLSIPCGRWLALRLDAMRTRAPALCHAGYAIEWVGLSAMTVLALAFLAAGTYNPFIYFRF